MAGIGDNGRAGDSLPDDKLKLHFSVKDTGIGISEDKLEAIFEEFTQADSSSTRKYGGTGLGLTISRRLTERMGGKIWVESLEGMGSVFNFTIIFNKASEPSEQEKEKFPLQDEEKGRADGKGYGDAPEKVLATGLPTGLPAGLPAEKNIEARTGEELKEKSLDILLVEDNVDNRLLIKTFLKKTPHRVTMAENGAEAVKIIKEKSFDLVLMDIQMPVMDGYTATETVRKWEQENQKKPVPIIALTAHVMEDAVRKALDVGCNAHLAKPIKKATLLEAVVRFTE